MEYQLVIYFLRYFDVFGGMKKRRLFLLSEMQSRTLLSEGFVSDWKINRLFRKE